MTKKPKKQRGNISQRGEKFRVRVFRPYNGKYESFTMGGTLAEVRAFANQKYREFQIEREKQKRGELVGHTEARFSELLAKYRAEVLPLKPPGGRRAYEESLRIIEKYFVKEKHDPKIVAIRKPHVRALLRWMRINGERVKPVQESTLATRMAVTSALFSFAVEEEWLPSNPASKVKAEKHEDREWVILSDAEYELLLGACAYDPMLQMYVLLLGEAGLRADEALWLKFGDVEYNDVDVEKSRLTVGKHHRTKNGKVEAVGVSARLFAALKGHAATFQYAEYNGSRSGWLIHDVVTGDRVTVLRKQVKAAANSVGIASPPWRLHDLRHRLGTVLHRNGVPIALIGKQLRHSKKDIRTTMKYVNLADADLDDVRFTKEPQPTPA
jgi:integrase